MNTNVARTIRNNIRPERRSNKANSSLSDLQINWYLKMSYIEPQLWIDYMLIYHDLFSSENEALIKAKTHSLAAMCKYLHAKRNCSYTQVFRCLQEVAGEPKVIIDKRILDVQNRLLFACCLTDLDDTALQQKID